MQGSFDVIVEGGMVATPSGIVRADIAVRDGRIAALGDRGGAGAEQVIDARGLHVLPGVIDTQVHFREPGAPHKEDLAHGSAAAVMGGVTAVFEMPNTKPTTTTAEALADKLARARGRMWCDHAFFIGATAENLDQLPELECLPGAAGLKVFMGSSTGSLLIEDDATLERMLRGASRRVAVHAEDEGLLRERRRLVEGEGASAARHPLWRDAATALRATARLLRLARRTGKRVHVLHVTTAEEMALLAEHRDLATVEVTPQHLLLEAPDCYLRHGTRAQMNPPMRGPRHRRALWRALGQGLVDVLGSDHAPHAKDEKALAYPQSPSGMPGVQTLLPLMLDQVAAGGLGLPQLVELTGAGPARVYGIAGKGRIGQGMDADLVLVDLQARREIQAGWLRSACGWSPFEGRTVTGWPVATLVRGRLVMQDGELVGTPDGRPVRFQEALAPEAG